MIKCACGCGKELEELDSRGRPRRFIWGHHIKFTPGMTAKGRTPWNKGIKTGHAPWNKGLKGWMAGEANPFYGKKHSEETRAKMRGENNGNWNGGSSRTNDLIRKSVEYLDWKAKVFVRDNRMCILCGSTEKIEADHIKPFSKYPELRFDVNNGRTLCQPCHKQTPTYGNRNKHTS